MTAITVTPQPAEAGVLVELTGAPSPGAVIYAGTAEDDDSWLGDNGATVTRAPEYALNGSWGWYAEVGFTAADALNRGARRSTSGYVVGQRYRLRALVRFDGAHARLGVDGIGFGDRSTSTVDVQQLDYFFTATATSHDLLVYNADPVPSDVAQGFFLDDVFVEPAPLQPLSITRTDVNGVAPVRLLADQEPIGGLLSTIDTEAALRGLIRYTVTDDTGVVHATATLEGLVELPQLGVPVLPQLSQPVQSVLGLTGARDQRGNVHEVVDRPDPVVVTRRLGTRRGQLQLYAPTAAAAQALADLYDLGEVLHLRQPTHDRLDLYHHAQRVAVQQEGASWRVLVDYVEVAVPPAPRRGSVGWSFSDVAASYATFADVRASFESFAALTAGEAS